jgi:hypothetical protein
MTSRSPRRSDSRAASSFIAVALGLVALLAPTGASTQAAEAVALTWIAPAGCGSGELVLARVRQLSGEIKAANDAPLQAAGTVTRTADGGYHLHLVVRQRDLLGERHIEGRSCRDLAASAAVALALALRTSESNRERSSPGATTTETEGSLPVQATARRTGEPPSFAPATAAPRDVVSNIDAPPQAVREPRRMGLLLQVPVGALSFGPLQRPSYGVGAGVGLAVGRWRFLSEAKVWLPDRLTTKRALEPYAVDVRRWTAGVRGCPVFTWTRVDVAPCVMMAIEHLAAVGSGPNIAGRTAKSTWISPGIAVQARVHVFAWLRIVAGVDVQFQTSRPTLAIEGIGAVERLAPVGVSATLGAEWNL